MNQMSRWCDWAMKLMKDRSMALRTGHTNSWMRDKKIAVKGLRGQCPQWGQRETSHLSSWSWLPSAASAKAASAKARALRLNKGLWLFSFSGCKWNPFLGFCGLRTMRGGPWLLAPTPEGTMDDAVAIYEIPQCTTWSTRQGISQWKYGNHQ